MKTKFLLPVILVALAGLAFWQWEFDLSGLTNWIGLHPVLGAAMYLVLVVASVVLLPFSSLPLLPFAVKIYGVVATALLSAAGWWIGCLIAFQIARLGRRYLERVTSMEAVDRLEEKIPDDVGFGGIVVLRMILPVDVVSFALGLLKRLRLRTYAAASLVGIFAILLCLELRRWPTRHRSILVFRPCGGRHSFGFTGGTTHMESAPLS